MHYLSRFPKFCFFVAASFWLLTAVSANASEKQFYDVHYKARLDPESGLADVEILLKGDTLPSTLTLHIDPERHINFDGNENLTIEEDEAIWKPESKTAKIQYQFVIDEKKASGSYDSRITPKWAILRTDKMIPPIATRAPKTLYSRATLEVDGPKGKDWSAQAPYSKNALGQFKLKDPGRRLVRPKGWMIAGKIGSRQDIIDGTDTVIAAPLGKDIRRQDTLAFLSWTLPELKKVFTDFPDQLLVVMARDPMWRGGLSGTRSLYMHADRPLISGNRTSSMLHELVHVATGIHGDEESDWIVEGLAEYYSLQILLRTRGISEHRYQQSLKKLAKWGQESPNLLVKRSSGPTTARAVIVLKQLDEAIQEASKGESSLDDVVKALAKKRGEVTLEKLRKLSNEAAGTELNVLNRDFLTGKKKP